MRVKKTVLVTKKKKRIRKRRGYWDELVSCYYCPIEKTYPRRSLKNRRRVPVCITHAKEYDENHTDNWPNCPMCNEEEWNPIWTWGGSEEETTVKCRECSTVFEALQMFTSYQVWMHGKPVERRK